VGVLVSKVLEFPKTEGDVGIEAAFRHLTNESKSWSQAVIVCMTPDGRIDSRFVNPSVELLVEASMFLSYHAVVNRQKELLNESKSSEGQGQESSESLGGETPSDISH
jgi:hypothetical protein